MREELNFFEIPHPTIGIKLASSRKKNNRRHQGVCFSKGLYISVVIVFLLLVIATFASIIHLSFKRSSYCTNSSETTLLKTFVSFSHGSKAPDDTYPEDEFVYSNLKLWPRGPGALTERGRREAYELGKRLRQRYGEFLGYDYNRGEVVAYSTPGQETRVTGQLVLSALFPTPVFHQGNDEPTFKVIPQETDHMSNSSIGSVCPLFNVELEKVMQEEVASLPPEETSIIFEVAKHAGQPSFHPHVSFNKFWDIIYFQDQEGLSLPEWTKSIYPEILTSIHFKLLKKYVSGSDLLKKLVLHKYASGLKKFLLYADNIKMESHSWYVLNQLAIMYLLGVDVGSYPEPANCLVIEVHNKGGQEVFEVYYYENSGAKERKMLKMPCGRSCPLSVLEELVDKYQMENYAQVCHSTKQNDLNLISNKIFL